MSMVAHDGVGSDVDSKEINQLLQFRYYPAASVLVGVATKVVSAAKKSTTNAAADAVIVGCGIQADLGFS